MARIETLVRKVAPTPSTVLVTGESGTGKEVVARALHHHSARTGPFIPVNTAGIPEALLESELFGYERGAFTGAAQRRIGMFELAAAGTLFLDEIGELAAHLQVKLLRAVQERRIQRLGGAASVPIDARLLAATNCALEQEVAAGRFREDLYYRLNVVRIHLPPLRERLDDLPLLAGRILTRLNRTMGLQIQGLSPAALQVLRGYGFPGNVRELENILERAVIFAETTIIGPEDLDLGVGATRAVQPGAAAEPEALQGTLKEQERRLIEAALARWEGNRTRAAEELGITRRTLFNKLRQLGLG
jgi:two-component system response regulator AtoC